jgi:hypothetical protein
VSGEGRAREHHQDRQHDDDREARALVPFGDQLETIHVEVVVESEAHPLATGLVEVAGRDVLAEVLLRLLRAPLELPLGVAGVQLCLHHLLGLGDLPSAGLLGAEYPGDPDDRRDDESGSQQHQDGPAAQQPGQLHPEQPAHETASVGPGTPSAWPSSSASVSRRK